MHSNTSPHSDAFTRKAQSRRLPPRDAETARLIESAKQQLEWMIDANPQSMLLVGPGNVVTRANRAALSLLGVSDFTNILGKHIDELLRCDSPERLSNLCTRHDMDRTVSWATLPSGDERRLSFTIIGEPDGEPLHVMLIADASESEEEAKVLETVHKQEAVRALMVSLMHRVNQPLTVLLVQARLLELAIEKGTAGSDEIKQGVHEMKKVSQQIADILEQAEKNRIYTTEPYLEGPHLSGIEILNLEEPEAGKP